MFTLTIVLGGNVETATAPTCNELVDQALCWCNSHVGYTYRGSANGKGSDVIFYRAIFQGNAQVGTITVRQNV